MTDMTPEAINRKLAEWAGCKHKGCRDCDEGTTDCLEGVSDSDCPYLDEGESWEQCSYAIARQIPDYYRSNAAMDLLGVLMDKGISTNIDVNKNGALVQLRCSESGAKSRAVHEFTIPAAICHAIMQLIERKGR